MTVPVISVLRSSHPNVKITVLTTKFFSTLYNQIPDINFLYFKSKHKTFTGLFKLSREISKIKPDYVINLSGPSSVNESLSDNNKTKDSINKIFDNLINSSMELEKLPSFCEAGSSEMFSNKNKNPLNEDSKFETRSPYARAKYENFVRIKELRESYGWDIKTGVTNTYF